ncbi:alpha/beta hydrolase [Streptomyces sp. NPDC021098]|uniref:alpha/beta hydrolase n=1 Tax=unclassified Streptomyces TaxID=2593676 RepID=UPI003788A448
MRRDAAAEEASLFGHAPVAPDATAAYGDHPDQAVDFFLPRDPAGPAPLVVLFHGGAWRAPYDRHHLSPFAAHLAGHGLAVAVPEYRRGAAADGDREDPPGARPVAGRWPETLDDIAAVVDRLPQLVRESGLGGVDGGRVVLAGHSAGGHAALWAAARHRLPPHARWHLPAPPALHGVVALAPIADLTAARALRVCSDAVDELLGDRLAARLPLADPAALLPTGVPTVLVQGGTDVDVPPQVADSFAAAGAVAGEPPRVVRIAAVGHFPLIDPATAAARTVAGEIARLAVRDASRPRTRST